MRSILFVLLLTTSLVACKKDSGTAAKDKAVETKPAEVKPADLPAQGSGSAGAAAVATAEPVDVCAILTKEQVEKATKAKVTGEPTKDAATGSLLGGCKWTTDKGVVSVSARPIGEFDASAAGGTDVPGVGAAAKMTKSGLLMKLEGKPYFLHVMTMTGTKLDEATTKEVAMSCGGPPMVEPTPDLAALVLPFTGFEDAPKGTQRMKAVLGLYSGVVFPTKPPAPARKDEGPAIYTAKVKSTVVAMAGDRKAAWVAADLDISTNNQTPELGHATFLVEEGTQWQPLLVHSALPGTAKQAAELGAPDVKIPRKIEAGAEEVVKVFESTIGDPVALAKSVSDRKDAVLYGSEAAEKYIGGPAIQAALKKWKLGFKVRDGIAAGVTASKTVAWITASIDATPIGKAGAKATPYRATFIYEQTGGTWHLVVGQFSVFLPLI